MLHGLVVDGPEIHALRFPPERHLEPVDDQGTAVGNRDAATDTGRPEILTPLQHLEQHGFRLLVQMQQPDQFLEDIVLGGAFELQGDGVGGEELSEVHGSQGKRGLTGGRNVPRGRRRCQTPQLIAVPSGR